jgi:serine/threonine protein kinase
MAVETRLPDLDPNDPTACRERPRSASGAPERIGPYEVLEIVGRGGMGIVYRALDRQNDQHVAVKVLAGEGLSNPLLLRRFEQEYSAARRLRHPSIVQGLAFGVAEGRPYMAMELIEGESLAQLVRKRGPLPVKETVRLLGPIAGALHHAHREKLIHRDVKPENILVTRAGQAKLADLGLVKDLEGDVLTRTGAWVGTVVYMAPEQFGEAREVDGRCDVYGLAGVLYFALTGSSPFPEKGALGVLGKKLKNDLVPPRQRVPTIPGELDELIRRGLNSEPSQRPASCAEVAAGLAAVMRSLP